MGRIWVTFETAITTHSDGDGGGVPEVGTPVLAQTRAASGTRETRSLGGPHCLRFRKEAQSLPAVLGAGEKGGGGVC